MFAYDEGGRGSGALHALDPAPDRAAIQAGGEGRSECVSVPKEILSSRACVRIPVFLLLFFVFNDSYKGVCVWCS